jgi:tripartite-type tricarboxylate transporter receptor subunit TctC
VRLIVPTPAGGTYDLMGRLFMDRIGPSLGTAIVENRAGGNALVGVTAAAQAAPDGYTLVLGSNATHIIQTVMMRNPPYDPVKQFVPVSTLSAAWSCIAVAPKLGINTLAELIDYGRKNPGRLSAGHRGIGDSSHMSAELLKKLQPGFTMQYIPYSAMAQAVRDLISGDLDMTATLITRNLVELHEAGKIKLLAVSAPQRIGIAPDIPTAIEAGTPNMIAAQFFYLFAPAGTPAPIVQKLNDLSRTALTDATFKAKLESAGFDPHFAGGLEETRKFYEAERALWVPLAEASGEKTN